MLSEPWFAHPPKMESVVKPCHKAPASIFCKQQHSWLFLLFAGFFSLSFLFWVVVSVASLLQYVSVSICSSSPFFYFCLSACNSSLFNYLPLVLACCLFGPFPGSAWNSSVLTKEETKSSGALSPASSRSRATSVVPTSVCSKPGAEIVYREGLEMLWTPTLCPVSLPIS